MNSLCLAKG